MKTSIAWLGILVCACSGGGGGDGGSAGSTGMLKVLATDAPFAHDIVAEARIFVDKITVHEDGNAEEGFLTLHDGAVLNIDLLHLTNAATQELVQAEVPVGTYRQARIYVTGARLELTNGNVYDTEDGTLKLTSQDVSGFKIFIDPPLVVEPDPENVLLLDFDLTKTFHPIPSRDPLTARSYLLQPVIHTRNLSGMGAFRGVVTEDDGSGQQVPVQGATVYILPAGELDPDDSIASTGTSADGRYGVLGLEPGTYDLLATHGEHQGRVDGQQILANSATVVDVVIE